MASHQSAGSDDPSSVRVYSRMRRRPVPVVVGTSQCPVVEHGELYHNDKGSLLIDSSYYYYQLPTGELGLATRCKSNTEKGPSSCPHPPIMATAMTQVEEAAPFSDASSPVRAVLNRPWPDPILVLARASYGKSRTLVATAKDIGPPISLEELAALEPNDNDDMGIQGYKAAAHFDAFLRNYIHEHGELYQDEKGVFMLDIDDSPLREEIRCKVVTAEEMEAKVMKKGLNSGSKHLSELAFG
ncbi:hypothetical protein E2562_035574 [Oryza meyeriana var. granulata]|uniref:Uncharacterized protein n=1 Tax=Oryza meyeriana var. granulata TaxID=110450 RepID=A0A6G1ESP8_9ORYZ|nr:hypothetical protein E2562_035574 [Oryza meyeriana var. granulata]